MKAETNSLLVSVRLCGKNRQVRNMTRFVKQCYFLFLLPSNRISNDRHAERFPSVRFSGSRRGLFLNVILLLLLLLSFLNIYSLSRYSLQVMQAGRARHSYSTHLTWWAPLAWKALFFLFAILWRSFHYCYADGVVDHNNKLSFRENFYYSHSDRMKMT